MTRTNWAGNVTYGASRLHEPGSVEELQGIVRDSRRVKGLGSCHSFNWIADTDGDHVSLRSLPRTSVVDVEAATITVSAGTTYGELCEALDGTGFALPNLAALPHISVAGAIATATHGSGFGNGNLATAVAGLELVRADGEVVRLSRGDGDRFCGVVVHLGAIGIVTRVTFDLVPAFSVAQHVYCGLEHAALEAHLDEILSAAFSVSVFTNWRDASFTQIFLKRDVEIDAPAPVADFHGARAADREVHPILTEDAACCTPQLGSVGAWHERLPHFRMGFRPSTASELQTEYFVPREHATRALQALHSLQEELAPVLQISEIRTVRGDDLWMSTAFGGDRVAYHFTWKKDWPGVKRVLALIEARLEPYGVLPHWGKLATVSPQVLRAHCPRLESFRELVAEFDPERVFYNAALERDLLG